ncbi:MAG TPA: aminotransferase class V-fold PLP-dependent enzyme [Candidatus Limnocylindrales bacterium]|nr:aminotransferase class V-fold PLP-dependent enzyme [Candidatus Limnocylindrales bacterium]
MTTATGGRVSLPEAGTDRDDLRRRMEEASAGDADWLRRMAVGTNYPAGDDVLEVAKEAYLRFFSTNGLLPDLFPSLARFERELIDYAAGLFHGPDAVGSITSGGSESILMGIKSARDRARRLHPEITAPEMIVPESAHPAFTKGAHYFGISLVKAPLGPDHAIDQAAYRTAIGPNTVLLVASAPSLTLGMVDPIEQLAPLAAERNIGFHVDACVGGFFLPFAEKLGYPVPPFDFRVPGVTTISADLHKFGYAAKGASVIMSRNREIYENQPFRFGGPERPDDWYVTPSMTGTRPGGSIAAAWAVMTYLGEQGYMDRVDRTMKYLRRWWDGIEAIEGLEVMGEPAMSVFAVTSKRLDVYAIGKGMEERGWLVFADSHPVPALRYMQSPGHEPYVERYLADLREVAELVRSGQLTSEGGRARYT